MRSGFTCYVFSGWRADACEREVRDYALKEGFIWRVGDGSLINVWSDPRIPDRVTRRPTPRGHTLLTRVSELIDAATGTWDK